MKVKNTTGRDVSVIANREPGKAAFRIMIPAMSTIEFSDEEWNRVADRTKELVKKGIFIITDEPVTPLTATEICEVLEQHDVKVNHKIGKKKLQKMAKDLGIELEREATEVKEETKES